MKKILDGIICRRKLKKAIDFMETNLCNDISADDVAKEFCKNPIVLVHFLYNIFH